MLNVTLEQVRALDALARHGTVARAAAALGKQHGALVYALKQLERQTELELLDRSGYRTRLTPAGEEVLARGRALLQAEAELEALCHRLKTGWEPTLRVVLDGIFPSELLLRQLKALAAARAPTRVEVQVEFLAGVESAFFARRADLMISVLPPLEGSLEGTPLPPLVAHLVVGRGHPLAAARRVSREELAAHALITVRGSDPRLALPTAPIEAAAPIVLHDFRSKREAILDGLGYGWMPEHLVRGDLRAGRLRRVPFSGGARHVFRPHAYAPRGRTAGRAAALIVDGLRREGAAPRAR